MTREVTEADFRLPQYRDAKPEDYEFRKDGVLVRKDRWETSMKKIASLFDVDMRAGFECDALVFSVEVLIEKAKKAGLSPIYYDEAPK